MPNKADTETELDLLRELELNDTVTQLTLARRFSVSVGFVNAVLKRAISKGFVKVRSAPYRRYAYYITPKGFSEKARMVAEYLESSLVFFRKAQADYGDVLVKAKSCGQTDAIFAGSGELAKIALLAAIEADVTVIGILDSDSNASVQNGIPIIRELEKLGHREMIIVTDAIQPQVTFNELCERFDESQIFAPAFLRVSVDTVRAYQAEPGR